MKTAICLTGLIGNLEGKSYDMGNGTQKVLDICYQKIKKHLLDKNNVDIFLHSWETNYERELIEKYNPKLHIIEKQIYFSKSDIGKLPENNKRVQAHFSKWYSIKKAMELKQEYEKQNNFKYDFVLQSRFDLVWLVDVLFDNFDKNKFYIPKTSKGGHPWGWPNGWCNNEIGDLFFFSSSENMDKFSKLYDNINQYLDEGCPVWNHISNHMLAKYHLRKLNLLPNDTELVFDDGINTIDFQLCRSYVKNNMEKGKITHDKR